MSLPALRPVSLAAVTAFALWTGDASAAYVIGGQSYEATAPTESMSATFLAADGGVSTNFYSGLVRLVVSGSGQSWATRLNDAFYVYTGVTAPTADGSFYQLTTDDTALVGLNPAQDAKNFIVYDVDAGVEVLARPYVPTYRSDHTYAFIVDLGLLGVAGTSRLHFGVSDGVYSDNSGSYAIEITQLTRQAVPEPGTLLLVAASGLGLLASRRRRLPSA